MVDTILAALPTAEVRPSNFQYVELVQLVVFLRKLLSS